MEASSRRSSLPARSPAHSSRRLSSNSSTASSLSSLSELGMLEQHGGQQHRRSSSSSSSSSGTIPSSSPSSSTGNMMKKLGSRFTLKRKDGTSTTTAGSSSAEDAIEELADENEVLATARPRAGRTLISSNTSTSTIARPSSIYTDLSQSGGTSRLKHRSNLSNLNGSTSSNASVASNGGNGSVQRQPGTLRHRASIPSLSGSDGGTMSPPTTALRQPGTLRHRNSISSLSGSNSNNANPASPPSTAIRQPGSLRHRSSITSLSSVAMSKPPPPSSSRSTSTSQAIPAPRARTMSTTAAATSQSRPSHLPMNTTANESGNSSVVGSLSNSRRLSATHTGLASLRNRTTSLISPPKAMGLSSGGSGMGKPISGTASTTADTSIARRGIPKSSTTSISRIASTSASSFPSANSTSQTTHKRIGSLATRDVPPRGGDSTPKSITTGSSSNAMKRTQKQSIIENSSPGLEDLVNNTTLQMADLKDMLSPLAISKVVGNTKSSSSSSFSSSNKKKDETQKFGMGIEKEKSSNRISPRDENQDEEGLENSNSHSPSKSALPVLLNRTASTRIAKAASSSRSPSPTKLIRVKSASPKKTSVRLDSSPTEANSASKTHAGNAVLTKDGLPALPSTRNLALPLSSHNGHPFPSSTAKSRLSPSPVVPISSLKDREVTTPILRKMKESLNVDDEMERLLSEEGFLSPARFLTADSSTLLMQEDLSNVMMTTLRPLQSSSSFSSSLSSSRNRREQDASLSLDEEKRRLELEQLIEKEREKVKKEILAKVAKERENSESKASEERIIMERKLSEQEANLQKQIKEIVSLQKMLAKEAKNSIGITILEGQLIKQGTYDSSIRRMKREIEDLSLNLNHEKKGRTLHTTRHIWSGYNKELEVEMGIVNEQLETLDQLRGLVGHIALCMERSYLPPSINEQG